MSSHAIIKGPDWELVQAHAEWEPRDSCGYYVHNNELWIIGGWFDPKLPNPLDVWRSPDAIHWTKVLDEGPWVQTDLPATFSYDGKMWIMGGRKLPGSDPSNKVWSSVNGADWTLVNPAAAWCPRLGPGYTVFRDKMWLFGGVDNFYTVSEDTIHNDVWSSTDGVEWNLEIKHAPWPKRAYHKVLVMHDKLWLIGGGCARPEPYGYNDVWCSDDGVNWTCLTEQAPWAKRIWFGAGVYRDRLWVYSGYAPEIDNMNDVWFSENGADWTEMKSDVVFSPRHEPVVYMWNDRLWCVAAHANPLTNEVWSLYLPPDFFDA
jgi:hypothetical protein